MKVTEILKTEHQIILGKIDHAVETLGSDMCENVEYWEGFINFLKTFADAYHHAKEEDIYFEWMKEKEPTMEDGPLNCMLSEHDESRRVVQSAEELLSDLKTGDSNNWDQFKIHVQDYADILRRHIDKENSILYMMAEQLDQEAGDGDLKMGPLFEQVEERLGESVSSFV